jgi:tRNA A-37 threonylcarbamoyl transferase component Bud32
VTHALDPATAGRRVLKDGRHRTVVWLDAAGPAGEAVVVKQIPLRSPWHILEAWLRGRPASVQRACAERLLAAGVDVPRPLGTVEGERASTLISEAIVGAQGLLATYLQSDDRARRRFARELGSFVARLHASGVWVPDLKESNVLVQREGVQLRFVLVDLDRVAVPRAGLSQRRRIANLVQLDRSLGAYADRRERLAFLVAYRRGLPGETEPVGPLARRIERARRSKDVSVARRRRRARIKPEDRLPISCLVICGNEAHRIRDCLESVRWCDEVVVVDSYSTDGTWDIVKEYTTNAWRRPWNGHVEQKQYALDHSHHPWILNVDADECVSPGLREEIEEILAHDGRGYDGFLVPRVVYYLGQWWWRGGWYPDRRLRLFRKERAVWGGEDPHEKVLLKGRIGAVREPLLHYTYDDVADHVRTINRFTTTASNRGSRAKPATWPKLVLRPLGRFVRFYLWRSGYRLGKPGLFVAISAAVYVHLKYAKADERVRRESGEP